LINFKTYSQASGKNALKLAKIAETISVKRNVSIAVAPQIADLFQIANKVKIPLFAQHIDPIEAGRNTGYILPENVKAAGAQGTLINHSEHQLSEDKIKNTIEYAKNVKLLSLVCVNTPEKASHVAKFKPNMIAIEPPELIGTGISVSKAKPEIITLGLQAVKEIDPEIIFLCGAGISSGEDAASSIKLGARGVLLASGFVKAKNPSQVLEEMVNALL
jgi:triosephosphate isomerase